MGGKMAITVANLYRYPVKGLSAERLARTMLSPGECLPQDRRFAIALASTRFDERRPQWLPKTNFVMLMRDAVLAQLSTHFDEATGVLTIARGGKTVLQATITEPEGRRHAGAFFAEFTAERGSGPPRLVEAPGHSFADARHKPGATTDKYVSLVNAASIRALEAAVGAELDRLRFRANLYFEGAAAWRELDWIGSEIAVGAARLRIVSAITRCAATAVNPATAERDLDVVAALRRAFGHNLMGVYAEVVGAGAIAEGDQLAAPH